MIPRRQLLYLHADAMHCVWWRHGQLTERGRFPTTEEGLTGFARHVQRNADDLFTLLVDVAEEGFHAETLPHVRGPDRDAMLERKRGQAFFGSPLSGALPTGRETRGRRDERFMFVALTRHALIEPWLQALRAANAPLTGIYTAPLLLDRLVQRLGAGAPRCLLVSFAPGGMRQTFFDDGRLRFSRLAHGLADMDAVTGARCTAEILKTHSYLVGQRMIPRGTRLPVFLLADREEFECLRPAFETIDELDCRQAPLAPLARRAGLTERPQRSDALPLLLHWMARSAGPVQLAPPTERRFYRIWQARQAIVGTGVALFAAAMLYAGKLGFDGYRLARQSAELQARAELQETQLAALMAQRPALPAPLDIVQPALDALPALRAATGSPRAWLAPLSAALDAHPPLTLLELRWSTDEDVAGARGQVRLALPEALAEDRRAMLEAARAFVDELSQRTGSSARMTRMPVELQSDRAYRSSSKSAAPARPEFEVEFALAGDRP